MPREITLFADGLATVDGQPWSRRKARKAARCAMTGREISVGDLAYGPALGTEANRHERILASAVEQAPTHTGRLSK